MTAFRVDRAAQVAEHVRAKIAAATDRGLLSAVKRVQALIVSEIIPAESPPPVDIGTYKAGWEQRPEKIEHGWMIKNTAPHAPIIENGARASRIKIGRAMIDALTEWVVRKGLVPKAKKSGALSEASGIAWAIAKAMQKRGIFNRDGKGLRIAEKATKRAPDIVREEVARELKAVDA